MSDMKPPSTLRSQPTRDRILAAAKSIFALEGFERTTMRAVAAKAQCNCALVIRYYGSKEGLFAAAATLDLELPNLVGVPAEAIGERLVGHFLDRWERHMDDNELITLLRASVNHKGAQQRMGEIFEIQLCIAVAKISGRRTAPARAALIASHMLGLGLTRYVLKFPAAVALRKRSIVTNVGRTVQAYLMEPISGHTARKR